MIDEVRDECCKFLIVGIILWGKSKKNNIEFIYYKFICSKYVL